MSFKSKSVVVDLGTRVSLHPAFVSNPNMNLSNGYTPPQSIQNGIPATPEISLLTDNIINGEKSTMTVMSTSVKAWTCATNFGVISSEVIRKTRKVEENIAGHDGEITLEEQQVTYGVQPYPLPWCFQLQLAYRGGWQYALKVRPVISSTTEERLRLLFWNKDLTGLIQMMWDRAVTPNCINSRGQPLSLVSDGK